MSSAHVDALRAEVEKTFDRWAPLIETGFISTLTIVVRAHAPRRRAVFSSGSYDPRHVPSVDDVENLTLMCNMTTE